MDYIDEAAASASALQQDFTEYSAILGQQYPLTPLSPLFSDTTRTRNHSNSDGAINLTWRMESELAKAIQSQYLSANTILKSLLFTQSRLQWHLRGMSEFFFMMQGEVMHLFAANIFSKVQYLEPYFEICSSDIKIQRRQGYLQNANFFDTTDETQAALAR